MNDQQRRHFEELQQTYRRRLHLLELQAANFGLTAPPQVLIEIEDIQRKLEDINTQLTESKVSPYTNLPQPDYTNFIGREEEQKWLIERFKPNVRAWLILITGIGGVGKTALAHTVAEYFRAECSGLPAEERFEAIIWISAKEAILTAYGLEKTDLPGMTVHTLEDIYTAIAQTLEQENITRAAPEHQPGLVRKALIEHRTLLIVDNLETVTDERVKAFLRHLPAPTKTIITAREGLDVADILELKGLKNEEAQDLIIEETRARNVQLEEAEQQALIKYTARLPLPIKLSIARLANKQTFKQVIRWLSDATGDLAEYCVKGQVELVRETDTNAWKLLLACSLFDQETGASEEALSEVAGLPTPEYEEGLWLLQNLSLVNHHAPGDRFTQLPIVRSYIRAQLPAFDPNTELVNNWLGWLVKFAQNYGSESNLQTDHIEIIKNEYPNLLDGIRWCHDREHWEPLLYLAEGAWFYPHLTSLFNEFREILEYAIFAAKSLNNPRKEGFFSYWLGWLAPLQNQYEVGVAYLDRAEEIALQYSDNKLLAEVYYARSNSLIYRKGRENSQPEAEQLLQKVLEMSKSNGYLQLHALSASRLAQLIAKKGRFEEAHELLNQAEKSAKKLNWTHGLAWIFYRRGYVLIAERRYKGAEAYLEESLRIITPWGERYLLADNKYYLADVYLNTGRLELAKVTIEEAHDIFERLGVEGKLLKVEALMELIRQAN